MPLTFPSNTFPLLRSGDRDTSSFGVEACSSPSAEGMDYKWLGSVGEKGTQDLPCWGCSPWTTRGCWASPDEHGRTWTPPYYARRTDEPYGARGRIQPCSPVLGASWHKCGRVTFRERRRMCLPALCRHHGAPEQEAWAGEQGRGASHPLLTCGATTAAGATP